MSEPGVPRSGVDAPAVESRIRHFERDIERIDGYVYSTSERLSCRLSNGRTSQAVLAYARPAGRRILDVGCGDGVFTWELGQAGAAEVLGVDVAEAALESARRRCGEFAQLRFETADIYALPDPAERWDVAVVRLMLHHLDDPALAIANVCRVAREIVVVEPNGYNPILKVIERVSPYHVEHEEKSYAPRKLDAWFEACGARVAERSFIGLVPMFCPDGFARAMKRLEPLVEALPGLRGIACGQYAQRVATGGD